MEPSNEESMLQKKLNDVKTKYHVFLRNWIEEHPNDPFVKKYIAMVRLMEGNFTPSRNMVQFLYQSEKILQKMYMMYTPQRIEATVVLSSESEDEASEGNIAETSQEEVKNSLENIFQFCNAKQEEELNIEPETLSFIDSNENFQVAESPKDNLEYEEPRVIPARRKSTFIARRPSCAAKEAFGSLKKCVVKNTVLKPASIYARIQKSEDQRKIITVPYKIKPIDHERIIQIPDFDTTISMLKEKRMAEKNEEEALYCSTPKLSENEPSTSKKFLEEIVQTKNNKEIKKTTKAPALGNALIEVPQKMTRAKSRTKQDTEMILEEIEQVVAVKRGRGRPRKINIPGIMSPKLKKKRPIGYVERRGRPRKVLSQPSKAKVPKVDVKKEILPTQQIEQKTSSPPNKKERHFTTYEPNFASPNEAEKILELMQMQIKQEVEDYPEIENINFEDDCETLQNGN